MARLASESIHTDYSPRYQFTYVTYSRTLLSRTRLFRSTANPEVKIWSLLKHETMTTGNKIMWKRGEIAPKEQFLLFSTLLYIYISNFRGHIPYIFVKCGCSIYCFPHSLNSDMSRYGYFDVFSESLGIRDNESRLYYSIQWSCLQTRKAVVIMRRRLGRFRHSLLTLCDKSPF